MLVHEGRQRGLDYGFPTSMKRRLQGGGNPRQLESLGRLITI
jgi:hypothetical protein